MGDIEIFMFHDRTGRLRVEVSHFNGGQVQRVVTELTQHERESVETILARTHGVPLIGFCRDRA